ncbi:MAG: enoyl-CoA hydratase/isomerase family protein [Chloroflexi bacterium]|nr:enoyl-CoA hydratase/isomerase family protein [Chloroflexota bacterium]MDA1297889.1 enoyl-CoA hydratase/isomerase family protein [Chloroflexota bacterium]
MTGPTNIRTGATPGDQTHSTVLIERNAEQGVGVITLNRPARRNALNHEMLVALDAAISDLASDESVRAIVLTGAGASFCSGVDTNELAGGSKTGPHTPGPGGAEALRRGFELPRKVILSLFDMEKPVIAAIRGTAVGAGLDIACACDIRLATPDARFSAAYIKVGLFPGYGGVWFYPRMFGVAKAAEMMLTGDFVSAEEALAAGFINRIVPDPDPADPVRPGGNGLLDEARKLAARLAAGPPIATRLAKTMMHRSLGLDLATSLHLSAAAESITLSSEDHAEGMAAAREKRPPRYRGV